MTGFDDRPTLTGNHVELVTLSMELVPALVEAAGLDRSSYGFTEVPASEDAMADYVGRLVAKRDAGTDVPFAQRLTGSERIVGCTRYLELRRWRGRDEPDEVEIGGTWLADDVQRSAVNTEAKLLLLGHAFEHWGVVRVALCTDADNARSRVAIERIGARFEGIVRKHRPSTVAGKEGTARDTALFSVIDDEWPDVRSRLTARLGASSR